MAYTCPCLPEIHGHFAVWPLPRVCGVLRDSADHTTAKWTLVPSRPRPVSAQWINISAMD